MNIIKKLRDTIYNNVWRNPKGRLSDTLRQKCDEMSHRQRIRFVAILSGLFLLAAFFAFGHACYHMGQGHATNKVEIEHIESLELPPADDMKLPELPSIDDI